MAEQVAFNHKVGGSTPFGATMRKVTKETYIGRVFGSFTVIDAKINAHYLPASKEYRHMLILQCATCGYTKSIIFYGTKISGRCPKCNPRGSAGKIAVGHIDLLDELKRKTIKLAHQESKNGAQRSKREFDLSESQVESLIFQNCFYCGSKPSTVSKLRIRTYGGEMWSLARNGIDRVDSSRGYEYNNCVSCCETCNRFKRDKTVEEFLSHVEKIYNHSRGILELLKT